MERAMDRRAMGLLAFAHTADDVNQSFLPAILPALILTHHFTYQVAATLVLAQAISSSVIQPAVGYFADKHPMPWLSALGVFLAGSGIAAIGFAPTYPLMFAAALVSGVGVAAFHPEAARFANFVAGSKKATGMRWFALGGNIGFAIGPLLAIGAIAVFGIRGTFVAAIPVIIAALLLVIELPRLKTFVPARRPRGSALHQPDNWPAFWRLTVFVTVRSMGYLGLVAFIPLFFVHALGATQFLGSLALTIFLTAGALGTVIGGPLADRFSRRAVLLTSSAGAALLTALYAWFAHPNTMVLAILGLAVIGIVLVASQTAFVVLGQEFLPNHLGVASGVTLGLAVSLGGIASPALGWIGDHYGLHATLFATAAFCAAAFLGALTLPSRRAARAREQVPVAASPVEAATVVRV